MPTPLAYPARAAPSLPQTCPVRWRIARRRGSQRAITAGVGRARRSSLLHAMFDMQRNEVGRMLAAAETYSEHLDVADPLHFLVERKIVLKRQHRFGIVERHEVGADTPCVELAFVVAGAPLAAEIR
jgi:hypothetical protein